MDELEFTASRLRTKIKKSKRLEHFFDAAKYEAELEIINQEIKDKNV